MSNHTNHRRSEQKRTEHGSRWEKEDGSAPSVNRARSNWRKLGRRLLRHTGKMRSVFRHVGRTEEHQD
jgi:hypothetical protein